MAFLRNILLPSKRVIDTDTDMEGQLFDIRLETMEAGNHSDLGLGDMEEVDADNDAAHPKSTIPYSFPEPNTLFPLFTPGTTLNTSGKRSSNDDRNRKVRVVEQGSNIPAIVRLHFS
jgi:hypothetical protein